MENHKQQGEWLIVNEPTSPNWEHPSGRNGKHKKGNAKPSLTDLRKTALTKIAEIKAKPYENSRKDRTHWEKLLRHIDLKLAEGGVEHSRMAKGLRPPSLR